MSFYNHNCVQLVGNIVGDVSVKDCTDGKKIMRFSVSTGYKTVGDKSFDSREYHNVVIFSQGFITNNITRVRKGVMVFVTGELRTEKWNDKDGKLDSNGAPFVHRRTVIQVTDFGGKVIICESFKDKMDDGYQVTNAEIVSKIKDKFDSSAIASSDFDVF